MIRIRFSFLMPIPGLESKRCPTPSFTVRMLDNINLYSKKRQFTMFFLSQQWHRCHDFKFFLGSMLTKVVEKNKKLQYMSLEKMPIEIRRNDADPTRTGFRIHSTVCGNQCCGSMTFWCGSGSGSADPCL